MVFVIALIFAFRIFGFMAVLPVLTTAATSYQDYSLVLVGLAIGVYGLVQACLHIPMGYLSDKFGRRRIVLLGLVLMLFGSIVAAMSSTMLGLIIGRAIQGGGAIGSVLNAWCADITPERNRTKAMALIGMTIGFTFLLAILAGPIIVNKFSLSFLFWLNAVFALIAMVLTMLLPESATSIAENFKSHIKLVLCNRNLQKLDFGIFAVHASYTALFLLIPNWINAYVGIEHSWQVYLPLLSSALLLSLPALFLAEAKSKLKQVLIVTAAALLLAHVVLIWHGFSWLLGLYLYFSAFTILEALLPSLLSKHAPMGHKGTAMGVFSCSQYLGIFAGGAIGGWLLHSTSPVYVIYFGLVISLLWLFMAVGIPVIANNHRV